MSPLFPEKNACWALDGFEHVVAPAATGPACVKSRALVDLCAASHWLPGRDCRSRRWSAQRYRLFVRQAGQARSQRSVRDRFGKTAISYAISLQIARGLGRPKRGSSTILPTAMMTSAKRSRLTTPSTLRQCAQSQYPLSYAMPGRSAYPGRRRSPAFYPDRGAEYSYLIGDELDGGPTA
jgi:hypothetical protein